MMNITRNILIGLLVFVLSFNIVLAQTGDEVATVPAYDLEVPIGSTTTVYGLADYIGTVYAFGVGIVGVLATVMIMFGGWQWIFAGGNEKIIGSAKEYITSAIIGLVLALGSYLILFTINPQLVELTDLNVWKIIAPEIEEEYNFDTCSKDDEALNDNIPYRIVTRTGICGDSKIEIPSGQEKHPYQQYTRTEGSNLSSQELSALINEHKGNVSPAFMLAILEHESRFCSNIVSSAPACGTSQFIMSTAKIYDSQCGVTLPEDDEDACKYLLNNPDLGVCLQGKYLNHLHQASGGDEVKMSAGYNAGEGRWRDSENCPGLPEWQCEGDMGQAGLAEVTGYVAGVAARKNDICNAIGGTVGGPQEVEYDEAVFDMY